jgi:hypothetical protein
MQSVNVIYSYLFPVFIVHTEFHMKRIKHMLTRTLYRAYVNGVMRHSDTGAVQFYNVI